jgi:hypothetical protein
MSAACCSYLVACFEAALMPAPEKPPAGYDGKHYTGSDVRLCNAMLFPLDCAIAEYRSKVETISRKWAKELSVSIKPELAKEVLEAMRSKFMQMISDDTEELAQGEDGQKSVSFQLDDTLWKRLKEDWPAVNRPANYKQRALAARITSALDASPA